MTLKEYLIYYLNIIPAIRFWISHCFFVYNIVYILIQYYSTNILRNLKIKDKDKNKDEQIYKEMHIVDWLCITQHAFINSIVQKPTVILMLLANYKKIFTKHEDDIMQ